MEDAPPNHFFLEYIARPQTAEMFFEDVLMAMYILRDAFTLRKTTSQDYSTIIKEEEATEASLY